MLWKQRGACRVDLSDSWFSAVSAAILIGSGAAATSKCPASYKEMKCFNICSVHKHTRCRWRKPTQRDENKANSTSACQKVPTTAASAASQLQQHRAARHTSECVSKFDGRMKSKYDEQPSLVAAAPRSVLLSFFPTFLHSCLPSFLSSFLPPFHRRLSQRCSLSSAVN